MVRVTGLDHIVLIVSDVERSLAWYHENLGLELLRVEEWRAGTVPFPSARIDDGTIIDFFGGDAGSGHGHLDHVCLVVDPTDLEAVKSSGQFEVRSGPGTRWGAQGDGTSLYVSDPDGLTIELRHY
jgi:catechol 2,3-dioxygenase-like lactoylglutathione lyase family enzyme